MKIAIVSDDGTTISQHFGRAPFYIVVSVENGAIIAREKRDKLGHAHFSGETHAHETHGPDSKGHGFDAESQSRHQRMTTAISDCEVLLARGMGAGAYESLRSLNIKPRVTDIANIDDAVRAYLDGSLVDHTERLH
jgi:predicted Fe-Mo cluster-binding NifX family protein